MKFKVLVEVDGVEHEEEVNAPDAKLAINKAVKLHPTIVRGVIPLEEQLAIEPGDHPGQARIDDQGEATDAGMEAIGDAVATEAGADLRPVSEIDPDVAERELEDLRADGSADDDEWEYPAGEQAGGQ